MIDQNLQSFDTCLFGQWGGEAILPPGCCLIAGVSGGGDSMALLHMLQRHAPKMNWELHVAHVNYGLRGDDSDMDQQCVEKYCEENGIPLHVHSTPPRAEQTGIEQWARCVRQDFFAQLACDLPNARVVLAHHARDQAETVLMHLIRGCGPHGLCGMQPMRSIKNTTIIRPLLFIHADLYQYCREHNVPFRIDKTNSDRQFFRNRVRCDILPALEKEGGKDFIERISTLSQSLSTQCNYLDSELEKLEPIEELDYSALQSMHTALLTHLLHRMMRQQGQRPQSSSLLMALVCKIYDDEPQWEMDLGNSLQFKRRYDHWGISPKASPASSNLNAEQYEFENNQWHCEQSGWRIEVSEETVDNPKPADQWTAYAPPGDWLNDLRIRFRQPGDRITLFGTGGSKKLKEIFIESRIPQESREQWPVLAWQDEVFWLPGLTRSNLFLLPEGERETLVFRAFPPAKSQKIKTCY
jgi:tRNA(Ile)-lysidine synthase